jgi:hypothetical protein
MTAGAFAAVVGASLAGWPFGLLLAGLTGLALGLGMGAAVLKAAPISSSPASPWRSSALA